MQSSQIPDLSQLTISEEDVKRFEQDQKEAKEAAHANAKETVIESLENAMAPTPPSIEDVDTINVGGYRYVSIEDYTTAFNLLSSSAPNGHAVLNVEFTKVIDLLRHSVGCLQAIGTSYIPGTVSERLDKVKSMANNTAADILKSLGI